MSNLKEVKKVSEKVPNSFSFMILSSEFYIISQQKEDISVEITKLEEELKYTQGFLESVMKKLLNEKFITNAPAHVIETEKKKKLDAETKINIIQQRLDELTKKN